MAGGQSSVVLYPSDAQSFPVGYCVSRSAELFDAWMMALLCFAEIQQKEKDPMKRFKPPGRQDKWHLQLQFAH